jgi:hypothetical protein
MQEKRCVDDDVLCAALRNILLSDAEREHNTRQKMEQLSAQELVAAASGPDRDAAVAELARRANRVEDLEEQLESERNMWVSRMLNELARTHRDEFAAFKTCASQHRRIESRRH